MSAPSQAARRDPAEPGGRSVRILAAAIILYPIVAIFSPNALVVLLPAASLPLLLDRRNRSGILTALPRAFLVVLAALAVWSLAGVFWSPFPLNSLALWARVVGMALCGALLMASASKVTSPERGVLEAAFAASGVLFVVIFAVELLTCGILTHAAIALWNELTPWESMGPTPSVLLARPSAALAVFAWPCALAIRRRHSARWAAVFVAAVAVSVLVQNMLASFVAFVCAVAVFVAVYWTPRWAVAGLVAALVVVNAALFVASFEAVEPPRQEEALPDIPNSWKERLFVLDFVSGKIAERPIIGWGFDASRAVGQDTPSGFANNMAIPLHPHNLWAQLWLELGLVGLVLLAGLAVVIFTRIIALDANRVAIAAAVSTTVAYLVIGNISYGMWQNWWLAVAWLNAGFLAAIVLAREAPSYDSEYRPLPDVNADRAR